METEGFIRHIGNLIPKYKAELNTDKNNINNLFILQGEIKGLLKAFHFAESSEELALLDELRELYQEARDSCNSVLSRLTGISK